ncbi:hypothetical protein OSB04_030732 [Centaurea solstitialis]|uniref:Tf2-1-like SH3-like domain-containing protein n=1 Tax=Centaurea solstitialis TaxID=347529 RepID=A0AA38S9C4_9ASTR|nr:hypothetical protein OSB04_030732 [Centaurea solstitialis]
MQTRDDQIWSLVWGIGKRGKLGPRFIGPFEIVARVGKVAYRLELPPELSHIHNTFHVSQLRKCLADESTFVPLEDIEVDERLNYAEKLIAVLERKTKTLRNKEIGIVKVQWEHRKGSEWTWSGGVGVTFVTVQGKRKTLTLQAVFSERTGGRVRGRLEEGRQGEIEAWLDWSVLAPTSIAFKFEACRERVQAGKARDLAPRPEVAGAGRVLPVRLYWFGCNLRQASALKVNLGYFLSGLDDDHIEIKGIASLTR